MQQFRLAAQQVHRGRQGQKTIHHLPRRPHGRLGQLRGQAGKEAFHAAAGIQQQFTQAGGIHPIVCLHQLQQRLRVFQVAGQSRGKAAHALHQLRYNQPHQCRNCTKKCQIRQQDTRPAPPSEQVDGKPAGGDIQHIGQRQTARKGRCQPQQHPQRSRDGGQIPHRSQQRGSHRKQQQPILHRFGLSVVPALHGLLLITVSAGHPSS